MLGITRAFIGLFQIKGKKTDFFSFLTRRQEGRPYKEKVNNKRRWFKKALLAFFEEIRKNLESYYVMDQRRTLGFLKMEQWENIKTSDEVSLSREIEEYAEVVEIFNKQMCEFNAFEQWYSSDIKNKTRENAQKLHDLRENLFLKMEGLKEVVKSAISSLENQMQTLKNLK